MAQPQKDYYSAYNLDTKRESGVPVANDPLNLMIFKYNISVVKEGGDDDGYVFSDSPKVGIDYERDRQICENIYFQVAKTNPAFHSPGGYFYNGQGILYSTVKILLKEPVTFGIIVSHEQRQLFRIDPEPTYFEVAKSQLYWTGNIPVLANGTPLRNMYHYDFGLFHPRRNAMQALDKLPIEHHVLDTQQILFSPEEDLHKYRAKRVENEALYQSAIQSSVSLIYDSKDKVRYALDRDSIIHQIKELSDFQPKNFKNELIRTVEEKYKGAELILNPRAANAINIVENQQKVVFIRAGPSANDIGYYDDKNFLTVAQFYQHLVNYPDLFMAFVARSDNQVMLVPVEFLMKPPRINVRSCVPNDEVVASTSDEPNEHVNPEQLSETPNEELDSLEISRKEHPFSSLHHAQKVWQPSTSVNPKGRVGFVNNTAPMIRASPGVSRPSTSAQNSFAIPQSLQNWIIFYEVQWDQKSSQKIEFILSNAMRSHGMDVKGPAKSKTIRFNELTLDGIKKIFEEAKTNETQLILFMLPKSYKLPENFGNFIKFCTVNYRILSQCMKLETIDIFGKLGSSLSYDFAGKTNLKLGGLNKIGGWKDNILLIGISFPTDRMNNADVVGYAHNMDEHTHKFAGKFILNKNSAITDREIILSILEELFDTLKIYFKEIYIWLEGTIDVITDVPGIWKNVVLTDEQRDVSIISLIETFPESSKRERYTTTDVFFVEEVRKEKTEICQFKLIGTTINSANRMDKIKNVTNMVCEDKQIYKKRKTIPTPIYVASKQLQLGKCVKQFMPKEVAH